MGNRRPIPNDFLVTFNTGAACCRLYSLRSTSCITDFTSPTSTPCSSAICSAEQYRSTYASRIGSSTSYGGNESVSLCSGRNSADGAFSIVSRGITSRSRFAYLLSAYTFVFITSPITASAPTISPYSVQYPTDISLLLPVVKTSEPNLFDRAISNAPRIRACRFSSANPTGDPANNGFSTL